MRELLEPDLGAAVIRALDLGLGFYVGTGEESLYNTFSALLGSWNSLVEKGFSSVLLSSGL